MKIGRKIELIPRIFIKLITRNKYYICEDCHKIHKRNGAEFDINLNWAITVNNNCANNTIKKTYELLRNTITLK